MRLRAALFAPVVVACLAAASQAPKRPRDPWVFRGRVDDIERAVTVALHAELWIAYDSTTCALRRAWNGRDGGASQAAADGARLLDGSEGGTWWVLRDGVARSPSVVWRGYAFRGQQVTLRYELVLDDVHIAIEETPELVRPTDLADDPASIAPWVSRDMLGLRRTFRASGIPAGASVSLALHDEVRGNVISQDLLDPFERSAERSGRRALRARLPLRGAEAWGELIYFFDARAASRARR